MKSTRTDKTIRGKAIAAARKKSGNDTNWRKVFEKLDKHTPKKRGQK